MLLSCGNDLSNVIEIVEQYIMKNDLPIRVGKEIIVYNDFNLTDKINFQIFMLNSIDKLSNDISEGNFNDDTVKNLIELQRILTGFYNYCTNNNYELAIIFNNPLNEKKLLIDYFEYYNYNLTFYNNWIILDNNTHYTELKKLIGVLLQIGDISRNNLINYLHDWNGENAFYKSIVFSDGFIETIDMDYNEYFDIVFELNLMNICYFLISDIIYLFKIKDYDLDVFANTMEEIMEKNKELEKLVDNYNNVNQ
jgi:hypothetical protein